MNWTPEMKSRLRELAFASTGNKDIAAELGVPLGEVHAKRSQMGITRDKVRAALAETSVSTATDDVPARSTDDNAPTADGNAPAPVTDDNAPAADVPPLPGRMDAAIKAAFNCLDDAILLAIGRNWTPTSAAELYCQMGEELMDLYDRYRGMFAGEQVPRRIYYDDGTRLIYPSFRCPPDWEQAEPEAEE